MHWKFFAASVIVIATPGTGALYCLTTTLTRGWRAGIAAAAACAVATVPHAGLAITGLASMLAASEGLYQLITYLGSAFLLWLAWGMWRDTSPLPETGTGPESGRGWTSALVEATTLNLLNPKLTLFFVAFLPQFVPRTAASPTRELVMMSVGFMVLTFVIYAAYAALAHQLRGALHTRPGAMVALRRVFAVVFVALGVYLGLTARV